MCIIPLSARKIEEPILPGQRGVEGVEPPRPEVEQGGDEEPRAAAGLRLYDPPHRTARLGLDPTDNKVYKLILTHTHNHFIPLALNFSSLIPIQNSYFKTHKIINNLPCLLI